MATAEIQLVVAAQLHLSVILFELLDQLQLLEPKLARKHLLCGCSLLFRESEPRRVVVLHLRLRNLLRGDQLR